MEDLVAGVKTLDLESDDFMDVIDRLNDSALNDEDKESIISNLYERSATDWKQAHKIVQICAKIANEEELGSKHRMNLVKILQTDFRKKEELRSNNSSRLLACVAMLSQALIQLKDQRGDSFKPLYNPVFESFEFITDKASSNDELLCAVHEINNCGRLLQLHDNTRWSKILQVLRSIVLDSRGSREVRIQIIDLVENCASGWEKS